MLDFRIATFLIVCKHMNYTKAAKELNITQPAVSQHIKYLEEYYGVKLFFSQGKRVQLTPAGEILRNTSMTMQHDEIHLASQLKSLTTLQKTLVFGATLTIGEYSIPKQLSHYIKEHPDTRIQMQIANTFDLLSKIEDGTIDFAIVEGYFQKKEYDSLLYSREDYIPVVSPDYEFQKEPFVMSDLFQETLITREEGSGTREILEKTLEQQNYNIHDFSKIIEIGNINTIKSLIKESCGITFLYKAAVLDELKHKTLKEIKLKDTSISHEFTFIWRKGSVYTSYYKKIFNELRMP
ncbi:MAG: LysR family transcriptional regulator [Anaerostipes sp.]|jgi:DNA-binding transcriptional LysR family regulator|nr:LysR family transcriptional regulator [Anaerostipes sp.]